MRPLGYFLLTVPLSVVVGIMYFDGGWPAARFTLCVLAGLAVIVGSVFLAFSLL